MWQLQLVRLQRIGNHWCLYRTQTYKNSLLCIDRKDLSSQERRVKHMRNSLNCCRCCKIWTNWDISYINCTQSTDLGSHSNCRNIRCSWLCLRQGHRHILCKEEPNLCKIDNSRLSRHFSWDNLSRRCCPNKTHSKEFPVKYCTFDIMLMS